MASDTDTCPGQNLNGFPISFLALTRETASKLRTLHIATIEQLAYVALLESPALRDEVISLLHRDLYNRMELQSLKCYVLPADENRETAQFIIESNVFSFVASVTSGDNTNPTCTYWWNNPRLNNSIPFHKPQKTKYSRHRKKSPVIAPDLQPELPLFETDSPSPAQNPESPVEDSRSFVAPDSTPADDPAMEDTPKVQKERPMQKRFATSYDLWNDALIRHFTSDVPRGTRIFLSIDDDGIAELKEQLDAEHEEPVPDFYQAVREHVLIHEHEEVSIRLIEGRNSDGKPKGVAFLAAMVVAASRMAIEEEYDQSNYFIRLREVLGLPHDSGRPPGMDIGTEECLWKEWARWLVEKGFLLSAKRGKSNYDKYINYPLSQALLRHTDRERLCKLFQAKGWNRDWDAETLGTYIRREDENLSKHLREILNDPLRYKAVINDMYELYEDWRSGDYDCQSFRRIVQQRNLSAGIYRTEDITGDITYYLYPRSPRKQHVDAIQVVIAGNVVPFRRERQGWYMPHYELCEEDIEQGASFTIEHPEHLKPLTLPQQPFWILIPDPENPESGVYASWGRPQLGTHFIILCRQELVPQLEHLRHERLLEWGGNPQPCSSFRNWVEIRHCNVISPAWDGVEIDNQDLYEKLCPRKSLNITLSGGLRVPGNDGWLEDHGPRVTIFGFQPEVDVLIKRATDDKAIYDATQKTNEPFMVPWPRTGDYLIEIPGSDFEQFVTIRQWKEVERSVLDNLEKQYTGDWSLCGALIEEVDEERQ
jgi:hypothetical protein